MHAVMTDSRTRRKRHRSLPYLLTASIVDGAVHGEDELVGTRGAGGPVSLQVATGTAAGVRAIIVGADVAAAAVVSSTLVHVLARPTILSVELVAIRADAAGVPPSVDAALVLASSVVDAAVCGPDVYCMVIIE